MGDDRPRGPPLRRRPDMARRGRSRLATTSSWLSHPLGCERSWSTRGEHRDPPGEMRGRDPSRMTERIAYDELALLPRERGGVRHPRRQGRRPSARPTVEVDRRGSRRERALAGGPNRPRSCSSTAARRTRTRGTRWRLRSVVPRGSRPAWARPLGSGATTSRTHPRRTPKTSPSPSRRCAPSAAVVSGCRSEGSLRSRSRPRRARSRPQAGPRRRHSRRRSRQGKAILDFVNGPQTFPSFDDIMKRTMEHNPTRTEASLRRGILHNAHQLDDGSWAWRYDRRHRGGEGEGDVVDAIASNPLWDDLSSLAMPILLLRGSLSPVVDDNDVAEVQAASADGRSRRGRRAPVTPSRATSPSSSPPSSPASPSAARSSNAAEGGSPAATCSRWADQSSGSPTGSTTNFEKPTSMKLLIGRAARPSRWARCRSGRGRDAARASSAATSVSGSSPTAYAMSAPKCSGSIVAVVPAAASLDDGPRRRGLLGHA